MLKNSKETTNSYFLVDKPRIMNEQKKKEKVRSQLLGNLETPFVADFI